MKEIGKLVYKPSFFDPENAARNYSPDIAGAYREGVEYALKHGLKTAAQLIKEGIGRLLMITDLQNDFRDGGRLPVRGTDLVVLLICIRIINGIILDYFAGIIFSLDGHHGRHVSFDTNYADEEGNVLDLSTHGRAAKLRLVDEVQAIFEATAFKPDGTPYVVGRYIPRHDPEDTVAYWKHLQATGQGDIWVFVTHCVLATDGADLHPLLAETIAFACGARGIDPLIVRKGEFPGTDSFGPISPCRPIKELPDGGYQHHVIEFIKRFFATEMCGVAGDFCDWFAKRQVMDALANTEWLDRLVFIKDCKASIVPNAEHELALDREALAAGIKFIDHDAPMAA